MDSRLTHGIKTAASYVNVCNSVDLCNEFSTLGSQSFCSNWVDEPQQILSEDLYAQRDVSWYGSEYSGYSIPNQYGTQHYRQVNLNPSRWCAAASGLPLNVSGITEFDQTDGTWSNGFPYACSVDSDCVAAIPIPGTTCQSADEDFR